MKISKILTNIESRAIYECEHCGNTVEGYVHDSNYYRDEVIPEKICDSCGKKSPVIKVNTPIL